MSKFYPLKPRDILKVLDRNGFKYDRTVGSHAQYEHKKFRGKRRLVTVGDYDEFDPKKQPFKGIIRQSGKSKKEFYKRQ